MAVRIIHLRLDTRTSIRSFTGICVNPTAMTVCLRKKNFYDAGYYKYHEAYHLLEYPNEKQILSDAYTMYRQLRKEGNW